MALYGATQGEQKTNSSHYPTGKDDGTCNEKLQTKGLDGMHGRSVDLGSKKATWEMNDPGKMINGDNSYLDGKYGHGKENPNSGFKEGAGVPSRGSSPTGVITDQKTTGRMYVGKSWN